VTRDGRLRRGQYWRSGEHIGKCTTRTIAEWPGCKVGWVHRGGLDQQHSSEGVNQSELADDGASENARDRKKGLMAVGGRWGKGVSSREKGKRVGSSSEERGPGRGHFLNFTPYLAHSKVIRGRCRTVLPSLSFLAIGRQVFRCFLCPEMVGKCNVPSSWKSAT
jgi:hypothetical protein